MGTRTAGSKRIGRLVPRFEDNWIEADHADEDYHFEGALAGGVELYFLRINSPRCEDIFKVSDTGNYDNRANKSFMLRVYRPRVTADHVAIIYNGLDETIFTQNADELFSFYDDLGLELAQKGILAILLPTPYHMNRALAYKEPELETEADRCSQHYIDLTIPTEALMARNWNIYRNHFQGFKETVELCRFLRPDLASQIWPSLPISPNTIPRRSGEILRSAIVDNVKVSLIGYSLGGLRALTEYLLDRHDSSDQKREPLFTACVAINSGGALTVLKNPPWVDGRKWQSMIDDLLCQRFSDDQPKTLDGLPEDEHRHAARYYAFLNDVFLGQAASLNVLGQGSKDAAGGLLFVIGGGDDLVPLESIKRFAPTGGVTIFQVAGLGHLFPYDPAWRLWKEIVFDVIVRFLDNKARVRLAISDYDSLARFVCLLDHELDILHYRSNLDSPTSFREASDKLSRVVDAAARTFRSQRLEKSRVATGLSQEEIEKKFRSYAESLIERLNLGVRRNVVHPGLYKQRRRALLVGSWLTKNYGPLQDSWGNLERRDGERIGETLVRLGVIREENLQLALVEQERELEDIRDQMSSDFVSWLKSEGAFVRV